MWNGRTAQRTLLLLLVVLAGCSSAPDSRVAEPASTLASTTTSPLTGVGPATTSTTAPTFSGAVSRVSAPDLPSSWRPGCPVDPDDLRKLELTYWGFDDQAHTGALIVHAAEAESVTEVFRRLYERRFPIRRMEPIDVFGGSDEASTAADNTSGFNCRKAVASGPPQWSAHAYGRAIDVNPVENPYILGGEVLPPAGAAYRDRSDVRPGMAVPGGELVAAFAAAGWSWGGGWANPDYQHFSATGS